METGKENNQSTHCKSEKEITIGLIYSIIDIASKLKLRNQDDDEIVEALRELRQDPDVLKLMLWNMPMESAENMRIMNMIKDAHKLMVAKGIIIDKK